MSCQPLSEIRSFYALSMSPNDCGFAVVQITVHPIQLWHIPQQVPGSSVFPNRKISQGQDGSKNRYMGDFHQPAGAYYHQPMAKEFHLYLCFQVGNKRYCFLVLPFGLSPAPWICTEVVKQLKIRSNALMAILFQKPRRLAAAQEVRGRSKSLGKRTTPAWWPPRATGERSKVSCNIATDSIPRRAAKHVRRDSTAHKMVKIGSNYKCIGDDFE